MIFPRDVSLFLERPEEHSGAAGVYADPILFTVPNLTRTYFPTEKCI